MTHLEPAPEQVHVGLDRAGDGRRTVQRADLVARPVSDQLDAVRDHAVLTGLVTGLSGLPDLPAPRPSDVVAHHSMMHVLRGRHQGRKPTAHSIGDSNAVASRARVASMPARLWASRSVTPDTWALRSSTLAGRRSWLYSVTSDPPSSVGSIV